MPAPSRSTSKLLAPSIASLLAVLLLVGTAPAQAATPNRTFEKRLVNDERREVGNRGVRFAPRLNRAATRHSRRMARTGTLHHNPNLRRDAGGRWSVVGENVGRATNRATVRRTLRSLHAAFMRSRPHRRNIRRGTYRRLGVGIARSEGNLWVTLVFAG